MKNYFPRSLLFVIAAFFGISGFLAGEIIVRQEVAGPIETNCYLIYDSISKEAAIFDAVGPVNSLIETIEKNGLRLKYIFATHSHMDHIFGIPDLKKRFPDALFAINRNEWEDLFLFKEWMAKNNDNKDFVKEREAMKQNPEIAKWFEYDLSAFPVPDIYLEDDQVYTLGESKIVTLLTPGHSAGGTSFLVGDMLFSGDLLFYRTAGRTDSLGGSKSELAQSIKRLYRTLPDSTKVYPGHGKSTDIASEKKENIRVRLVADTE
jgi:glyoxylase-like metal-dependent hydrolase (beta-lactamase superfamily II)